MPFVSWPDDRGGWNVREVRGAADDAREGLAAAVAAGSELRLLDAADGDTVLVTEPGRAMVSETDPRLPS